MLTASQTFLLPYAQYVHSIILHNAYKHIRFAKIKLHKREVHRICCTELCYPSAILTGKHFFNSCGAGTKAKHGTRDVQSNTAKALLTYAVLYSFVNVRVMRRSILFLQKCPPFFFVANLLIGFFFFKCANGGRTVRF